MNKAEALFFEYSREVRALKDQALTASEFTEALEEIKERYTKLMMGVNSDRTNQDDQQASQIRH